MRVLFALSVTLVLVGSLGVFIPLAKAQGAGETTCPSGPSPHVDGAISTPPGDEALAQQIEAHLRAALLARDIVFCLRPPSSDGAASLEVKVEAPEGQGAEAHIRIEDVLTGKRVERRVALAPLPQDGWALAVAASSDELLRASWAELVMRDAPAPAAPAPEDTLSRATAAVRPLRERRLEIVPEALALRYAKRTAFGGGLRTSYRLRARWLLGFSFATAFGLRKASTHGSLATDSVDFSLHAGFLTTPASWPVSLRLELAPVLSRLSFAARANAAGEASATAAWSVSALARLRGCYAREALRLCAALGMLWAINPQRARDEERVVASNAGPGAEMSLGVGAAF